MTTITMTTNGLRRLVEPDDAVASDTRQCVVVVLKTLYVRQDQNHAPLGHVVWCMPAKHTAALAFVGPIPWGHSGPLCHALSLSSWTSMRRRRATVPLATSGEGREAARSGEWAQHFSNSCCSVQRLLFCTSTKERPNKNNKKFRSC